MNSGNTNFHNTTKTENLTELKATQQISQKNTPSVIAKKILTSTVGSKGFANIENNLTDKAKKLDGKYLFNKFYQNIQKKLIVLEIKIFLQKKYRRSH